MEVNFFERRKILKNSNLLDLTPVRKIEHEIAESGLVTLLYPKFKSNKLNKLLLGKRSPYIHLKLDDIGTASWLLIDGKRNVKQIADELSIQLEDKVHPAYERVSKFLSLLYQQKYISFQEIQKK